LAPQALHFVNLWFAGMLLGNEAATALAVTPAAKALPVPAQVTFQQVLARRYKGLGPLLFFTTLGSGIAVAATIDSPGRSFAIAGSACIFAMVVITFAGNMPVNLYTFKITPEVDPEAWHAKRRTWNRAHWIRVALDAAALACFLLALFKVTGSH
jgi:hypothetical protein